MQDLKTDTIELIRNHLPKYLTPDQITDLFKNIQEHFPFSTDPNKIYRQIDLTDYFYQGDCLIDIPFALFNTDKFINSYFKAIILSNTCDISVENDRLDEPYIQFANIFTLKSYIDNLKKRGIDTNRIDSFVTDLKLNRISNLFYLPEYVYDSNQILEESFVRFDFNVSLPLSVLNKNTYNSEYFPKGDRLFSLSNYGFYLFLIKLSVHFCRFREGVFRY